MKVGGTPDSILSVRYEMSVGHLHTDTITRHMDSGSKTEKEGTEVGGKAGEVGGVRVTGRRVTSWNQQWQRRLSVQKLSDPWM